MVGGLHRVACSARRRLVLSVTKDIEARREEKSRRTRQAARSFEQVTRSLDVDRICQLGLILAARRKQIRQVNDDLLILHRALQVRRLPYIALDQLDVSRELPGSARVSRAVGDEAANLMPLMQQFVQGAHAQISESTC